MSIIVIHRNDDPCWLMQFRNDVVNQTKLSTQRIHLEIKEINLDALFWQCVSDHDFLPEEDVVGEEANMSYDDNVLLPSVLEVSRSALSIQ